MPDASKFFRDFAIATCAVLVVVWLAANALMAVYRAVDVIDPPTMQSSSSPYGSSRYTSRSELNETLRRVVPIAAGVVVVLVGVGYGVVRRAREIARTGR